MNLIRRLAGVRLLVAWVLVAGFAGAADPPGLVVHFPFDGSLDPVVGKELGTPRVGGKPEFVEGKNGKAVLLAGGAYLVAKLPPAIRKGEFSIAFWVQPRWHPKDGLPHPILEIPDQPEKHDAVGWAPGQMLVSKGWSEAITPDYFYGVVDAGIAALHLKPNQWTHFVLVFSVSGRFTGSYIDGEGFRLPQSALEPPTAHGDEMWLGTRAGGQGYGDVAIDDLRIYDRALAAEEVAAVAGVTFPPPFDHLSMGNSCDPAKAVETPHREWGKPLYGGPLKVLFITEGRRAREAIELGQRLEMDLTVFTVPTIYPQIMANVELFQNLGKRVDAALAAGPVDSVVVAAFAWNLLPDPTRAALLAYVHNGGGLFLVEPRCLAPGPGPGIDRTMGAGIWFGWEGVPAGQEVEKLVARLERSDEEYLTLGIPWQQLGIFRPELETRSPHSFFRGGKVGKGRLLIYDLAAGGVYSTACLTPNLSFTAEPFDLFEYDYAIGAAARGVLWAAGRDREVRLQRITAVNARGYGPGLTVGAVAQWVIELWNGHAEPVRAQLRFSGRSRAPAVPFEAEQDANLAPGLNRVTFEQNLTAPGALFGDVRLLRDGKVTDWGTAAVQVGHGNPWFLGLRADRAAYRSGAEAPEVTAEVTIKRYAIVAGEVGEIRWRLYDGYERLLGRGTHEFQLDPGDEFVTAPHWRLPPLPDSSLTCTLVVDLAYKDRVTDQRSLELHGLRTTVDDYVFASWQGGGTAVDCLATLLMRDTYGLGCGGVGSAQATPVNDAFLAEVGWLARHDIRPWIYATHIGGGVNADKVRMPDLADPVYLRNLRARLAAMATLTEPYSPLYYSLGDETKLGPPDARATGYEQEDFRLFVQARYTTLDGLNQAWGSQYKAWTDIVIPPPEDIAQNKGSPVLGELASFREGLYARPIGVAAEGVRSVAPQARVGVEGIFGLTQAWTGQDYWKMTRNSSFMGMYACGMEMNMVRSFQAPGALLAAWWNYTKLDPEYSRFGPWHILLRGAQAFMWYTTFEGSQYTALNPDFTPSVQFQWTNEELQPLLAGVGKLVLGLQRDDSGVVVLYEQRNLDRCSPQFHSMMTLVRMLEDLGIQHDFVHGDQVAAGGLEARRAKVLVLPGQFHMAMPVAAAIRAFVAGGGALIADVLPADANGFRRYDQRPLDDLFPESASLQGRMPPDSDAEVTAWASHAKRVGRGSTLLFGDFPSSYNRDRLQGKGAFLRQAVARFLAGVGVEPAATARATDGSFQPLTLVTYHDGDALYVGMQRDYAVPDPAPREFEVAARGKAYVYDVLKGQCVADADRAKLELAPARGALLAFLPYKANGIAIEGLAESCCQGETATLRVVLDASGGRTQHGVFRFEALGPNGGRIAPLCRKERWTGGMASWSLPIAVNDPVGEWTIRVADIATGAQAERKLMVRAPPTVAGRLAP